MWLGCKLQRLLLLWEHCYFCLITGISTSTSWKRSACTNDLLQEHQLVLTRELSHKLTAWSCGQQLHDQGKHSAAKMCHSGCQVPAATMHPSIILHWVHDACSAAAASSWPNLQSPPRQTSSGLQRQWGASILQQQAAPYQLLRHVRLRCRVTREPADQPLRFYVINAEWRCRVQHHLVVGVQLALSAAQCDSSSSEVEPADYQCRPVPCAVPAGLASLRLLDEHPCM